MEQRVAAYITIYEDEEAATKCLQAIKSQTVPIALIFIVDNSKEKLLKDLIDTSISVHHFPLNIGIGQGLILALEHVTKEDYQFLWTFDQDSIPALNCLEILLTTYNHLSQQYNYEIGIISPTSSDTRTSKVIESTIFANDHFAGLKHNENVEFYECDAPITSGSLISVAAAQSIAPPDAELFIDGIDFDYGFRLRQKGFHNLVVTKATMFHNLGNPMRVKFINQYRYVHQYPALRHYYICRNHTYLETRFSQRFYRFTSWIRRIKSLFTRIFWITLYDRDDKYLKVWACLLGTYHGFIGKLGKLW